MQEVLDTHNLQPQSRTDARKEQMDATAVWDLMGSAERIVVAKGRRVETFVPTEDTQAAILKVVMGRSGNLRAPTSGAACPKWECFPGWLQRDTLQDGSPFRLRCSRMKINVNWKDSDYGCEWVSGAVYH